MEGLGRGEFTEKWKTKKKLWHFWKKVWMGSKRSYLVSSVKGEMERVLTGRVDVVER